MRKFAALGALLLCCSSGFGHQNQPTSMHPLREILETIRPGDQFKAVLPRIEPYWMPAFRNISAPYVYCKDVDGAFYVVIFSPTKMKLQTVLQFPAGAKATETTFKIENAVYLIPKEKAGQPFLPKNE